MQNGAAARLADIPLEKWESYKRLNSFKGFRQAPPSDLNRHYQGYVCEISIETMCENHPLFTHFLLVFHIYFTCIFHMCVKFCIVKMCVKTVGNDVNPFTHIFTSIFTWSFTRKFYVNLDNISHEFSPFISHAFSPFISQEFFTCKSNVKQTSSHAISHLFHLYFKPGHTAKLYKYIFTLFSPPCICNQHFTIDFTFS